MIWCFGSTLVFQTTWRNWKNWINILGHNQILSFGYDLVDMHSHVKQMEELLNLNSNEIVPVVGISGAGGMGKTILDYCIV